MQRRDEAPENLDGLMPALNRAEESFVDESAEYTLGVALVSMLTRDEKPGLLEAVSPEDFANPHLGEMWAAGRRILAAGKSISKRTLIAERDTPPIQRLVSRWSGEHVSVAELPAAVRSVQEAAKGRRLAHSLKRIAYEATSGGSYSAVLDFAHRQLADLDASSEPVEGYDYAAGFEKWKHAVEHHDDRVTPTPWPQLNDFVTGGLKPKKLYIVGARPGNGKTLMLLNMATYAAAQGKSTAVFSLEVGVEEIMSRAITAEARVSFKQMQINRIDADSYERINAHEVDAHQWPLRIYDDDNMTVDWIASKCRRLKRERGLDLVMVDYLQLVSAGRRDIPRQEQVAEMSRAFKILSKELDCAIVIACQLNRNAAAEGHRPTVAELRESGALEQDADVVMLLQRQKINGEPGPDLDVILDKNRNGAPGTVTLTWAAHQARLK